MCGTLARRISIIVCRVIKIDSLRSVEGLLITIHFDAIKENRITAQRAENNVEVIKLKMT